MASSVSSPNGPGLRWSALAIAVFGLAIACVFGPVWSEGPRRVVPVTPMPQGSAWAHTTRLDTTFVAWLVGRNAYTLSRQPWRLFDAEHCAPSENSLTFGEPMITQGLLSVPGQLVGGDPILSYNIGLVLLSLFSALAMFFLVSDWTRSPPAGIVAGLLYAFSIVQLRNVSHPFVQDTSWTVWALFFSRRLFAHGHWRDAVGLAASGALQLCASLYPLLAALFVTPPFALWLLIHYRLRKVRVAQLLFVVAVVALAAFWLYAPYLEARASLGILERSMQTFAPWRQYLPGASHFPGWLLLAFSISALLLGRRRCLGGLGGGDPRWWLLLGGALVAWAAAGGNQAAQLAVLAGKPPPSIVLPNLYTLLASVLPGLDSVRAVASLRVGVHLVLSVLAGLGAAGLLAFFAKPRAAHTAAAFSIALAFVVVLRPAPLGLTPGVRYEILELRPEREVLMLLEDLESAGDRGAIFELPVYEKAVAIGAAPRRIFLSAYHHRRTSACFGSYFPPTLEELAELGRALPEPEAARELARRGFTTLFVHHPRSAPGGGRLRAKLAAAAKGADAPLRFVDSVRSLSVFALPAAPIEDGGS